MKLCFWTTAHRPSLFPLVSTPLLPRSDSRKTGTWSTPSTLQRARPARISPVTSALRGIPGLKMVARGCGKCSGKGAIECPGCKGTGKNKKNGNMFERWKCYECQGFGLLSCPNCGKGGLTPEQRGERWRWLSFDCIYLYCVSYSTVDTSVYHALFTAIILIIIKHVDSMLVWSSPSDRRRSSYFCGLFSAVQRQERFKDPHLSVVDYWMLSKIR